jgi:hypothetical protein
LTGPSPSLREGLLRQEVSVISVKCGVRDRSTDEMRCRVCTSAGDLREYKSKEGRVKSEE